MVGERRGKPGGAEPVQQDEEKRPGDQTGPVIDASCDREAAVREAMEGPFVSTDRVRFSLSTRRARIDPSKKRARFVRRLEKIMRQCDRIVENPEGAEEIQVKAMGMLIRAIQVCYVIVIDIEVEELEREVEEIQREEGLLAGKETEKGLKKGQKVVLVLVTELVPVLIPDLVSKIGLNI